MNESNGSNGSYEEAFRKKLAEEDASDRTLRGYCSDIRLFAGWWEARYGQEFAPGLVIAADIRTYRDHLVTDEPRRSGATVNRALASLRKLYEVMGHMGLMGHMADPTAGVHGMEMVDGGVQSLTQPQYNRLLREVEIPHAGLSERQRVRDMAILGILCEAGLRVGELVALRVDDVDLRHGRITIRNGKGRTSATQTLNGNGRRLARAYVEGRQAADPTSPVSSLTRGGEAAWLFLGERGPMTAWGVWSMVRKYGDYAQIEGLTPHRLRHTYGRRLVDAGIDLPTIQALMRHKRIETTMRYVRSRAERLVEASEKISEGGE